MPKTLIIMRHAKSDWDSPGTDAERPLNARGREAAKALGNWLRAHGLIPDTVLCSSAIRAGETATRLKLPTHFVPQDALYLASSDRIMSRIQAAKGDVILLVAHNPGIGDFVERLAMHRPDHPRFRDFPTGATAVFECPVETWAELGFHRSKVTRFITPRELV